MTITQHTAQARIAWLKREMEALKRQLRLRKSELERMQAMAQGHAEAVVQPLARIIFDGKDEITTEEFAQLLMRDCPAYAARGIRYCRRRAGQQLSRWDWVENVGRGRWRKKGA